jgi:arylformamidase
MSEWIDISIPLDANTVAWPGDRAFESSRECALEAGAECNLSAFAMSAHLGTHIDSPLHYLAGGDSMDRLPFGAVIGPARVIEVRAAQVGAEQLAPHAIQPGERVLLKTPNSDREWRTRPFDAAYAHLTAGGAEHLAARRPALIGIDYLSAGPPGEGGAEVHRILLQAGVWIVESLDLRALTPGDYDLICLPLRIAGIEGAPARALLRRRASVIESSDPG